MGDDWLDDARKDASNEANKEQVDTTTWAPQNEGDEIVGKITDGDWAKTQYGPAPVLTVEDADGKMWSVWMSAKVLKDFIGEIAPAVGSRIFVVYNGSATSQAGRVYKKYFARATGSDHAFWHGKYQAMLAREEQALQSSGSQGGGITAEGDDDDMEAPF